MTDEQINIAIKQNKLPKDELDNLSDNIAGTGAIIIGSLIAICGTIFNLVYQRTSHSESELTFVLIGAIITLFYTIWVKVTERKLLSLKIDHKITKEQVKIMANRYDWEMLKKRGCYYTFLLRYGISQCKLTIILKDNAIYYNIRPKGSYKGRIAHLFGFEIPLRRKIERQINDYIQQKLNFMCGDE